MEENKRQEGGDKANSEAPSSNAQAQDNHGPDATNKEPCDSNRKQRQGFRDHWRSSSPLERWTFAFTGVIAFATFCYAVFSGWQLYEIHSGSEDTHMLAEAAKRQTEKTETISASIQEAVSELGTANSRTKAMLDVTIKQFHLEQRAWVSVVRDNFKWNVGSEMIFPCHFINTGKTPAKHFEAWVAATVMKSNEKPEFIYKRGTGHPLVRAKAPFLWPSEQVPFPLPVFKKPTRVAEKLILTRPLLEGMDAGTSYVLMYGKITYVDVFGIDHWMTFCDIYPTANRLLPSLSGAYARCIAYNETDEDQ